MSFSEIKKQVELTFFNKNLLIYLAAILLVLFLFFG